jgi:hypothetical protein
MKIKQIFAGTRFIDFLADKICPNKQARKICIHILFMFCGYNARQLSEVT